MNAFSKRGSYLGNSLGIIGEFSFLVHDELFIATSVCPLDVLRVTRCTMVSVSNPFPFHFFYQDLYTRSVLPAWTM